MAVDDIIIKYGIGFASSYNFVDNPWPFEPVQKFFDDTYHTSSAQLIRYRRAARWVFTMRFPLILQAQRDTFNTIKNTPEPYQLVLPATFADPSGTFQVAWMNDFDFKPVAPFWTAPFTGTIVMQETG